jgi:peroxiredoxin Q/BCP
LRFTFYIGADGRILYIDKNVSTSSAGEDIVARLEALGVSRRGEGDAG